MQQGTLVRSLVSRVRNTLLYRLSHLTVCFRKDDFKVSFCLILLVTEVISESYCLSKDINPSILGTLL